MSVLQIIQDHARAVDEERAVEGEQRRSDLEQAAERGTLNAVAALARDHWGAPPPEGDTDLDGPLGPIPYLIELAGEDPKVELRREDGVVREVFLTLGPLHFSAKPTTHGPGGWRHPEMRLLRLCPKCGQLAQPAVAPNLHSSRAILQALDGRLAEHQVVPDADPEDGPLEVCNGDKVWMPEPPAPIPPYSIEAVAPGAAGGRIMEEMVARGYHPIVLAADPGAGFPWVLFAHRTAWPLEAEF